MNDMHTVTGTVWAVFGHRFAIEGKEGHVLADIGPKGAEDIAINQGDTVTVKGERKPSEIKVSSITLKDGTTRDVAWPKPHGDDGKHESVDPAAALAAVKAQGYAVEGELKRKPKHFEIVESKDGAKHEFHVEPDGKIRKSKVLAA
jgi:hypothetical protein